MPYVLVLYYSLNGSTEKMAKLIGRGVESTGQYEARIRTVPPVSSNSESTLPKVQKQEQYTALKKTSETALL